MDDAEAGGIGPSRGGQAKAEFLSINRYSAFKSGNLTYDGRFAYTYDAWNRLASIAKAYRDPSTNNVTLGSTVMQASYDGLGRRTVKQVQNSADLNATYHYYYHGQSVVEERNGSDLVLRQYLWANLAGGYVGEFVQVAINEDPLDGTEQDCERIYYAMQDANFNVLGIVDDTGTMVERYEYTPYGQRTVYVSAGSADPQAMTPTLMSERVELGVSSTPQPIGINPIGHQGLMHDEASSLIYNRARMLHPRLGRFVSRDPHRTIYPDGMNGYAVYHAMRGGADPTGMKRLVLLVNGQDMLGVGDDSLGRGTVDAAFSHAGWRTDEDNIVKAFEEDADWHIFEDPLRWIRDHQEEVGGSCHTVVIIGHSNGGDGALKIARQLQNRKERVELLIVFDPVGKPWHPGRESVQHVPHNVQDAIGFRQTLDPRRAADMAGGIGRHFRWWDDLMERFNAEFRMQGYQIDRGQQAPWGIDWPSDPVERERIGISPRPQWPHTAILYDDEYQQMVADAINGVPVWRE